MSLAKLRKYLFGASIPVIRLTGAINSDTYITNSLDNFKSLSRIDISTAQAVALVINSNGGSPVQCEIMIDKLHAFCKDHHLPLYTFAEDAALSGGYFLLCTGDKVIVDKASLIGSIGAVNTKFSLKRAIEDQKLEVRNWASNEHSGMHILSPMVSLDDKGREILQKMATSIANKFINHVEKNRDRKITVPKEERNETLYQANFWIGTKAVELGLADGLGSYLEVLPKEFPGARLVEVTQPSKIEQYREGISKIMSGLMNYDKKNLYNKLAVDMIKESQVGGKNQ